MALSEDTYNLQFIKYGNKMKVSSNELQNNILTYTGNNQWNTGYCNAIYMNKNNKIDISMKIHKLSVSYGCVIGIVDNPVYINQYFHFNKDKVRSYAFKSASSQFCNGKKVKVKKKGSKFKTGDIVRLIIQNNTVEWFINDELQCMQKDIDKDVKCWYLGVAMLAKNDTIEIIKFTNTQINHQQHHESKQDK